MKTLGYAAPTAGAPLAPYPFERRALRPNDIAIEILYCGVCHTDLHMARDDEVSTGPFLMGRRRVAGSPIGGIVETSEMLDFCARKNILPDCELIRMDQINEAFERMERSDVRYRFGVDMSSLKASGSSRVVRGGSWHQTVTSWRSAFRRQYDPDYRGISIGFRVALSVDR